jgi:6-phosphogluconolactonase (cycloisomerase 2 family)
VAALSGPPPDPWPAPAADRIPAAILDQTTEGSRLFGLSIDPTSGRLAKVTTLPFPLSPPSNVAVTPNGDLAFAWKSGGGCVQSLRVNGLGGIAAIDGACTPALSGYLLAHPTRRLLYTQDFSACCPDHTDLHTFQVSADGTLCCDDVTPIPWGTDGLQIHPNGVFAYRGRTQYCIDASGVPEPVATLPADTPDLRGAVFDWSGRYLITSVELETHRIDSQSGLLSLAARGPVGSSGAIAVHPSRDLVFVHRSSGQIDSYGLDQSTGALTLLATLPAPGSSGEHSLYVEPAGRFLYLHRYVGLEDDLVIDAYRIESDGSLTNASTNYGWPQAGRLTFFLGPPF